MWRNGSCDLASPLYLPLTGVPWQYATGLQPVYGLVTAICYDGDVAEDSRMRCTDR